MHYNCIVKDNLGVNHEGSTMVKLDWIESKCINEKKMRLFSIIFRSRPALSRGDE